jgi:hypothetical protein
VFDEEEGGYNSRMEFRAGQSGIYSLGGKYKTSENSADF